MDKSNIDDVKLLKRVEELERTVKSLKSKVDRLDTDSSINNDSIKINRELSYENGKLLELAKNQRKLIERQRETINDQKELIIKQNEILSKIGIKICSTANSDEIPEIVKLIIGLEK